jgi:hypothetical protein
MSIQYDYPLTICQGWELQHSETLTKTDTRQPDTAKNGVAMLELGLLCGDLDIDIEPPKERST